MYIVVKYKNSFVLAAKQAWKACQRLAILPVSKARTNKFYIYQQCTYIVYISFTKMYITTNFKQYFRVLNKKNLDDKNAKLFTLRGVRVKIMLQPTTMEKF